MKKIYFAFLTLFIAGCTKNVSKEVSVVKTELEKKISSVEMDGIDIKSFVLSDRETFKEILQYHRNQFDKYGVESIVKDIDKDFENLKKAKGEKQYHRVEVTKANPDTTLKKIYYLDEKNNIIFLKNIK